MNWLWFWNLIDHIAYRLSIWATSHAVTYHLNEEIKREGDR